MTEKPTRGSDRRPTPPAPPARVGINLAPQTPQGPSGADIDRLEAVRDRLEAVLADPATTPRDLAQVSREYRQVLAQLAELSPSSGASPLDEIAARRQQRKGVS